MKSVIEFEALAARVGVVAGAIGARGPLPRAFLVSDEDMRAAGHDKSRPPVALIRGDSGDLWVHEAGVTGLGDETIIHELAHHFLRTSRAAGLYPHRDSDVDGHGALFASLVWTLCARIGANRDPQADYDLGRSRMPGDRAATVAEEQWARCLAVRGVEGTAEQVADRAIRDYRRWYQWQQRKARVAEELPSLLRFVAAVAAALATPMILAHL